MRLVAFAHSDGVKVAEVAFLLFLIAGVWIVSASLTKVLVGVPLLVAAQLDGLRVRWFTKTGLVLSVPALTIVLLYVPTYGLAELGVPFMLVMVTLAWLVGFAFGPLIRGVSRLAGRT